MISGLPIDEVLPDLRAALQRHRNAVVEAPPGAGKSTVVPIALLDEPWLRGGKIIMLEPRRLATRAVATRMATTLGEAPGDTVGYRMRMETRVSRRTRIEVVTEGVFTRMLQSDPALEGVGAVLFDEFHERSLHADTGLAFALDSQENLAPELRLLVMSATLDGASVARLLGDAPVVTAAGRMYPVETHHLGTGLPLLPAFMGGRESPELAVIRAIKQAMSESPGDMLVFLPGAGEIRRVQGMLDFLGREVDVYPLYGELAAGDQDAALRPAPAGRRKIVLATNIAETSLTIDGVRIVIDAGLERRSLFDPSSGMNRLELQRISRASAEQRAGRAGRTAPGVCYRLWGEGSERSLAAYAPPEVVVADLAPLALDLAVWGTDAGALRWLDAPPAATLASARDLLQRLGALDDVGKATAHGRAMQQFPAHPRVAHMLLKARELGAGSLAAELAALLSDRDLLRAGGGPRDSDMRTRLEASRASAQNHKGSASIDRGALDRVRRARRQFEQQLGVNGDSRDDAIEPGVLLGLAYPDRIARRRPGADARYLLSNGRGAVFAAAESIARAEFIVAVDLDDREREARIQLAAPLSKEDLLEHFAARIVRAEELVWDERTEAVTARRVLRLDSLVIEEKPLNDVPRDASAAAMLEGVRSMGIDSLPWDDEARNFVARSEFVRKLDRKDVADWPALSSDALAADLAWLEPFLEGATRRTQLTRVPLLDALQAHLGYERQRRLEELAPTHVGLPTGTRTRIDYLSDNAPIASMRMQEVFGLAATPRIGGGAVPVTFELLSPARRPLQVTRDLASFWKNAYLEVRKDMRGRYPRHYWPENPLEAEPTRRVKPRS